MNLVNALDSPQHLLQLLIVFQYFLVILPKKGQIDSQSPKRPLPLIQLLLLVLDFFKAL